MRVVCLLALQDFAMHRLAEACYRYTPQIAMGERTVFLEISRCSKLYSERTLYLRLQVLLKKFALRGRITFANDLPTAKALAVYQTKTKLELPLTALNIYVNVFQQTHVLDKAILALQRFGLETLKDFLELPKSSLASRFGKDGLLARHHVDSSRDVPWPPYTPPQKIVETEDIDESFNVKDLEPLLFILKPMISRTVLRLQARGRQMNVVQVMIQQENHDAILEPTRKWQINFAFAQNSPSNILTIVRDRLERDLQRYALQSPVCRVEFEVLRTSPGQGHQRDFFCQREQEEENFKSITSRLIDKLGAERVFHASARESYLPERSWQKSLTPNPDPCIPLPTRPMRVLKTPQKIQRLDEYFILRQKKWKILNIIGPEKLSGEWWFKDHERLYFRVMAESGEELWIFSRPDSPDYYLHGIFD